MRSISCKPRAAAHALAGSTSGMVRLLIAGALLAGSAAAYAQTYCIPAASGVPALPGAPNWWNTAPGEPDYWPRLDDPRWRGALARSSGTGASEHVSFRALRDASALYLSWHVKVDPHLGPFLDSLRVAFSPGGSAADQLMEVFPFTSAASNLTAAVPPSTITQRRTGVGGTWVAESSEPTWLATAAGFTRVWLDIANQGWGVNMRVPIAAAYNDGINLSAAFRMWYELQVSLPDGPDADSNPELVYYRLDNALTLNDIQNGANASTWPQFNRTLALGSPGCVRGVSITSTDVGTKYVDSGGNPRPNRISLTGTNSIFAHPLNETGGTIAANQVCAQFRIANWGTQPDWNDVPNPTQSLWRLISPECGLPGNLLNPGSIANGAKADIAAPAAGANELAFDFTLSLNTPNPDDIDRCSFIGQSGVPASQAPDGVAIPGNPACPNATPTRRLHQCMLVELSGGGFNYTPASVYRNMDFVNASTFARDAEISVAGLQQLPGVTARDVYLYVKTYNLPKDVKAPPRPDLLRDLERLRRVLLRQRTTDVAVSERAVAAAADVQKVRRPQLGIDFDVLNQVLPTYVVHAYHDTGLRVTVRGADRSVMRPQSSFGYYLTHEGSLGGWDHALDGAQQIAPNYYLIATPEGGAKQIRTAITARPEKRRGCGAIKLSAAGAATAGFALIGLMVYWPRQRGGRERDTGR